MWWIYWINVIDNLNFVLGIVWIIALIFFIVYLLRLIFKDSDWYSIETKDAYLSYVGRVKKGIFISLTIFIIAIGLNIFTPDKTILYTMAAVKGAELLTSTPEASKAREAVNLGLDKIIKELKQ